MMRLYALKRIFTWRAGRKKSFLSSVVQCLVGFLGAALIAVVQLKIENFDAPFLPLFCYGLLCFWLLDTGPSLVLILFNFMLTNYIFVTPLYKFSFTGAAGLTSMAYATTALISLWFFSSILRHEKIQARLLCQAEEVARRNEALATALKASILMRDNFVATAGHELRTPLTHLYLRVQNVVRRLSEPGYEPTIEKILKGWQEQQKGIERVARLVDQLLDVARIDSRHLSFKVTEFEVGEVMRDIGSRFAEQAEQAGCQLIFSAGRPTLSWTWDKDRFDQLLSNLLSNAIKYAPGAPVVVHWGQEGPHLTLSVCDYGPGIAEEARKKVFDRFGRVESDERKIGGLGLGLWICRQIVESAGGTITLKDGGIGCNFLLRLPQLVVPAELRPQETAGLTLVAQA